MFRRIVQVPSCSLFLRSWCSARLLGCSAVVAERSQLLPDASSVFALQHNRTSAQRVGLKDETFVAEM
jgi:hypothetical protein